MADLPELNEWAPGVYQLETSDPVLGGPDGIDNLQAKQLAARTLWLKTQLASLSSGKQPLDATLTALAGLVTTADRLIYATGVDTFSTAVLSAFARTLLDDLDAAAARTTLGAAPLASPAFTGTPSAPTAVVGTNTTQLANTAFVQAAIAALVASSPVALDTLNELAAALGNDPNFATTVTNALAGKASKATTLLGYGITDAATVVALEAKRSKLVARLSSAAVQVISGATVGPVAFTPLSTSFQADGGMYSIRGRLQLNSNTIGAGGSNNISAVLKNGAAVLDTAAFNIVQDQNGGYSACFCWSGALSGTINLTANFAKTSTTGSLMVNGDLDDITSNGSGQLSVLEIFRVGDVA